MFRSYVCVTILDSLRFYRFVRTLDFDASSRKISHRKYDGTAEAESKDGLCNKKTLI